MKQEPLVLACHHHAKNKSLPFVHTARRYYRLSVLVRFWDCWLLGWRQLGADGNLIKLKCLEEVKVVTRFP